MFSMNLIDLSTDFSSLKPRRAAFLISSLSGSKRCPSRLRRKATWL
jgi:hypothetical protein